MKITSSMMRFPVLTAVPWCHGLEVPGGELVERNGKVYLNEVREGCNIADPEDAGSGYTKALNSGQAVVALYDYHKQ